MATRIEIDGWKSGLHFSACHAIPKRGKCERFHGHTYALHIKIHGKQDKTGVIYDFTEIKHVAAAVIEELDHKIIIPTRNKSIKLSVKKEVELIVDAKRYIFPKEDVAFIDAPSSTAEDIADYILEKLLERIDFPSNISEVEVGVDEGWGQGAWTGKKFREEPEAKREYLEKLERIRKGKFIRAER